MKQVMMALICASSIFSGVAGQQTKLILTQEQNDRWIDSLTTLPLEGKIIMIKERLLSDTNIFIHHVDVHGTINEQTGNRVRGKCRPLIIVNEREIDIANNTKDSKILALTKLLTKEHIAKIVVLKGILQLTTAIYGTQAQSGVILITLAKKKYMRAFKRLKLV